MKKIILLCSVAFMFACSNENGATTQKNLTLENVSTTASRPLPPIEDEIDEMFYNYVTSSIYLEIKELLSNFRLDLVTDLEFETPEDMIEWITNNIESTNFSNIEEAQYRWNHLADLAHIEKENFPSIYSYIAEDPEEQVIHKIGIWLGGAVPYAAPKTCEDKLNACTAKAASDYYHVAKYAVISDEGGMAHNNAKSKHEEAAKKCSNDYIKCITK